MAALGKLVVNLSANIAEFTSAMDRATYTTQRRMDNITSIAKKAGAALAGVFAVDTIVTFVRDTARAANELEKFAGLAGATTSDFQALAYATRTIGIESEKLADIYKDFNDKLGDFRQTGGGALADFFDQIAPKVGVTVDSFRDLSGPQGLQLYVNSLEQANLSQADLVFYMEAIASDSSALLPLLRDNGHAMSVLANEAEALGIVMDESTIKAAREFDQNLSKLSMTSTALARDLSGPLILALNRLSTEFLVGMRNSDGFFDALMKFGTMNPFNTNAENLENYVAQLEQLEQRRQRIVDGNDTTRMRGGTPAKIAAIDKEIELVQSRINYLQQLQAANEATAPDPVSTGGASMNRRAEDEAKKAADNVKRYTDGLIKQIESAQNLTAAEQVLRDIQMGRITGVTAKQQEELLGYARQIDTLRQLDAELDQATRREEELRREAERRSQALADAGRRVYEETRTPLENLNVRMGELNSLLQQGAIDWDTYSRAIFQAQDRYDELTTTAKESTNQMTQLVEGWANSSADAFADFAMTGKLNFRGLVNSMIADLVRLAAKQAILNAVTAFFPGFKFADGGIMTGGGPVPLRGYATGGIANSPQLALFGEGSTPEAFVPLPDGRTIPVTLNGGAGGGGTSNVTVNVNVENGSMQTTSQGDASQLGKVIAVAVRSELINQRRPGGLLAA